MKSDKMSTKTQDFLGGLANSCGGTLNSIMIVLGDRFGLYKTGQYRTDRNDADSLPTSSPLPTAAQPSTPARGRWPASRSTRTPPPPAR